MTRLWQSTPVRLTVILGGAFLLLLALTGIVAYHLIQVELDSRLARQLEQSFSVIAQGFGEGDILDMTEIVQSNATANPGRDRVFLLTDAAGASLAGNIDRAPAITSGVVPAGALGLTETDETYRIYSGAVGSYRLLVGASQHEVEDIGDIVLGTLTWSSIALVIAILGLGFLLASRGQRRLDSIAGTLTDVGRGELTARIPLAGSNDDIDALSRQVNAALDRIAALVDGMRQVSVDIAHDLKTPLNRLSLLLQHARHDAEQGAPVAASLVDAVHEIGQIGMTFDALLRIAQIEAGALRARFAPVNMAAILKRLGDAYIDVAEENGQTLAIDDTATLPQLQGDRDLLLQLFSNLIENAIRHCPPGACIAVDATPTPGALTVTVADTGPGIPPAERDNVFRRLYRLDKSRTTAGNGLGLSMVKAIADLHHASVTIEDNQPGARFVVRLLVPERAP